MNFNIGDLSAGMWLVQTVTATFFTAGFVALTQYIWRQAFATKTSLSYRVLLTVLPLACAAVMAFGGATGFMAGMLFTNLSLFVLVIPLFDQQITLGEYLIRAVALLGLWSVHHVGHFTAWASVCTVILIVALVVVRVQRKQLAHRTEMLFGLSTFVAIAFWLTIPPLAMGLRMDARLAGQAIAMFLIMAVVTDYYWARQWQQYRAQKRLEALTAYDNLTNAKTYSHDQADITALFEHAKTAQAPLTLVALDIDRLKQINQEYGHLAGNAVLIQAAETLLGVLRQQQYHEHLYRTGGEEFNIAFPDATPDEIKPVLRDCWQAIHDGQFSYEGVPIPVTISIGATAIHPEDEVVDDLYKRADDNLYASKRRGRDAITVDGTPVEKLDETVAPTYAFYMQPINNDQEGQPVVCGNELLLRTYDNAQECWVLPNSFDLAIDQQVELIYQAVSHASCKNVAINLTLAQFADPQTAHALISCLRSEDGPSGLTVEIVDVPDLATTRRISAIYRAAGIRIHIDDVGSDNSYELVQQLLPYVDGVKFAIQNLRKTESLDRIRERIRFWVGVAKKNHLRMILEGVENQTDVDFASVLGIRYFQGYFYAKPALPVAA
ncbi:bifunctional diguanylate cyclase/phosphodiesterase [Lacticaseibacillus sp. GG6-2]